MDGPDHHLLELLSARRYLPPDECTLMERVPPTSGASPAEGREKINSFSSLDGTKSAAVSSTDSVDQLRGSENISMETHRLRSTRRVGRPRLDARGAAVLSEVPTEVHEYLKI